MRKRFGVVFVLTVIIFIAPCGLPAFAEDPLVMGIFPRRNAKTTFKLFKPMEGYLSERLGRKVKLETQKDFAAFWKNLTGNRYDIVHFNQYHYVKSHKESGYEAIAMNEEFGSSKIGGAVYVRKDSGIDDVTDLKGKKVVFGGGKRAMMSYIVATHLLRRGGLNEGDYEEDFAKSPPNAVLAVFYKQAVAAGAGDIVIDLPVVVKKINTDEIKMLARSERHAHLVWSVRGDMAPELKQKIQNVFTTMKENPEGRKALKSAKLTALVRAVDSDFDPHRAIIAAVKGEQY